MKDFCSHNYPQTASNANLSLLMSHSGIATQISQYKAEYSAASAQGKPYIMGETNSGMQVFSYLKVPQWLTCVSATGGGGGISPTFGAALWVMDYSLQLILLGVKVRPRNCSFTRWLKACQAAYFHQGTIGACMLFFKPSLQLL